MTSTGRSSRAVGRPRAVRAQAARDPLAAAVEVWTSVVSGLESARYAEVGNEYAKLSALLVQQRTAQVLAGAPVGQEWDELSRLAQCALDLLEPLLGAARLLATMPRASVPPTTPSSPARRRRPAAAAGPDAPTPAMAPRKAAPARDRQAATARSTTTPPAPRAATKRS
jgi:hypothetical protein